MVNKTIFKLAALFLLSGLLNFSFGQACSNVFISEYIEGGANSNKAIEIYNSSYATIDLSTYSLKMYGNGSATPGVTISLSGMLAADSVYVIANPLADPLILAQADLTDMGISYNGNDAIVLFNGLDTVDIFGVLGQNPGVSWTGGGLSTSSQVLVRKYLISVGETNNPSSFDPSSLWDGFVATDFSNLGKHFGTCHSACAPSYVNISDSICLGDSVLFSNTYYQVAGTYVDSSLNIAGCDSVTTLTLTMKSCSANTSDCSELLISEYTEGLAGDQAIEIYNPSGSSIGLNGYEFRIYQDGASMPTVVLPLSGTIQARRTHLVVNSNASSIYINNAQQIFGDLGFDGNDAIVLFKGTDTVDVFGVIGNNPGAGGWLGVTEDRVIVRKQTVKKGVTANPSSFNVSTDWTIFPAGYTNDIAIHTSDCDTCATIFTHDSATICQGDSVFFAGSYRTSSGFYLGFVTLPSGCDSVVGFTLTVDSTIYSATISDSICVGDSVLFGLTYYSSPGTYFDTATVVSGCDSVTTLILTNKVNCNPIDTTSCTELFFSEYIDGGGTPNRALEIFNPTGLPVNLSGYSIEAYGNGSVTPGATLSLSGTIAPYGVYVVVSQTATDVTLLGEKDTSDLVAQFNGNDAIVLKNGATQIDLIGKIGDNPGVSWFGGGVSTANQVMVRKTVINKGITTNPASFNPSIEWIGYPNNDFSHIGYHISDCKCTPDSLITYDSICSGDSVLFAGNYYNIPGTYYDSNTNVSGCDSIQTLILSNKTNCVIDSINCNELIISEYIEGTGLNKVIELYNPKNDTVDMDLYSIHVFTNGSSVATNIYPLTGVVAAKDVYVIANFTADPVYVNASDKQFGALAINGNDAFALLKGTDTVDIFGVIGQDPGAAGWMSLTTNNSLTRKSAISKGITTNSLMFNPSVEWIANGLNDTANVGFHLSNCDSCVTLTKSINQTICQGDSVLFGGVFVSMAGSYVDSAITSSGCDSISTLQLIVVNGFNISISNTVCNGDSILFAGTYYNLAGTYVDSTQSSGGCDSITTLTLSVGTTGGNTTITDSICNGDTVIYGGVAYTSAGTFTDTIQTVSSCDSILTITITLKYANNITVNDNICPGDSVLYGGVYYKNPGTYIDTITSLNSCDTILTLNLTANSIVIPAISIATTNNNVCSNQAAVFTSSITNGGSSPIYQWSINGANAATGSTFNSLPGQLNNGDTIKCFIISSLSCAQPDTAYSNEVVMIVNGGSTDTIIDTICEGTDYFFGSDTIITSGVYYDTVASGSGCDSITMLMLQVNTAPIVIANNDKDTVGVNGTISFTTVSSNASIYTWDFGDGFSANLTSATHTFSTPGTYQVVLIGEGANGCIANDTVTIVVVNDVSLTEFSNNRFVKVYPNPVNDNLTVSTVGSDATFNGASLFDAKGTLVKQIKLAETNQLIIDMSLFEKGFYYLSVTGNSLNKNIKLTKF